MDLDFSEADEAFRAEVRAWPADRVPATPLPSLESAEGFAAHRSWEAELSADRWSVVSWPEEYGGRGASILHWLIFEEEYFAAGAPGRVSQNGINLLAPTLFEHGTADPQPGTAAYTAAKAGLLALTKALALEWAPEVRVNHITTGLIRTESAASVYGADAGASVAGVIPMERMAVPADVARACLFLASDLAGYVNGADLAVHGGGEFPARYLSAKSAGERE
ncbi:SDR family oxidoreductase [Streptomyces hirsutus]|uniref:SDR family oxidoreductase n=1 Tax=Streptomyces hirsutus TaxID=35620 RepID=UPI0036499E87